MGALMKIDGARAEVASNRGASLDIVVRRLKSCVPAFCLLVVSLLPLGAFAQITGSLLPNAVPPSAPQRPSSGFEPIGLRVGDFFWFPRAELDETYNSNIFATNTSPTHDFITAVQPSFDLLSIQPRGSFNVHGNTQLQFYARNPAQNTQDGSISVDGGLPVAAGSALFGDAQVSHQHISYGSPNSPGDIAQPVTYWSYLARAGYRTGGRRFSYQIEFGVEAAQYNAAPLVSGGVLPQS